MLVVDQPDIVVVPPFLHSPILPYPEIVFRMLPAAGAKVVVQLLEAEWRSKNLGDMG